MRGEDYQQGAMYSYISPEQRVPQEHPLRAIREIVDAVLKELSPEFARLYAANGRPSIAPEKLLRALAVASAVHGAQRAAADGATRLQPVVPLVCGPEHGRRGVGADGVHEEPRPFAGRRYCGCLFRWRGGKDSLARAAERRALHGGREFLEAWAGAKSFIRKDCKSEPTRGRRQQSDGELSWGEAVERNACSTTEPDARLAKKGKGKEAKLIYTGRADGKPTVDRETRLTKATGTRMRGGAGNGGRGERRAARDAGRGQRLRPKEIGGGAAARKRDPARGAERETTWWQRHRWTYGAARGLRNQPAGAQTRGRDFWLDEDDWV